MVVKGSLRALSAKEFIDVVTVGTVPAQGVFIEQPLDAAIQTNSVRGPSKPDRPAHLPVAAATKDKHSGGFENVSQLGSPLRLFISKHVLGILVTKVTPIQHVDSMVFVIGRQNPAHGRCNVLHSICELARPIDSGMAVATYQSFHELPNVLSPSMRLTSATN